MIFGLKVKLDATPEFSIYPKKVSVLVGKYEYLHNHTCLSCLWLSKWLLSYIISKFLEDVLASKHPQTSQTINFNHKANILKRDCIFHRVKEEPAHTIIMTGQDASYWLAYCHKSMLLPIHCYGRNNEREWRELVKNACSNQVLLIPIEIKDVDEDRRKNFVGFHKQRCEVFLKS